MLKGVCMPRRWTREEAILAFALYCETPFGKIHTANSDIQFLARMLDRTQASVSMKMCNFARFDAALQARGVAGLLHGSHLDEEIWNEFNNDWESLIYERKVILDKLCEEKEMVSKCAIPLGRDRISQIKIRTNQDFFRKSLLAAYGSACCITGINIPALLIASHIKPWQVSNPKNERLSPTNGLLLNPSTVEWE